MCVFHDVACDLDGVFELADVADGACVVGSGHDCCV